MRIRNYFFAVIIFISTQATFAQYVPKWPYPEYNPNNFVKPSNAQLLVFESVFAHIRNSEFAEAEAKLRGVLLELGFLLVPKNQQGSIELLNIPLSYQISVPLNAVLAAQGRVDIQIIPQKVSGLVTSFADADGVHLDISRFLLALSSNGLTVIAHEATHFFHLQNISLEGTVEPAYNFLKTALILDDPELSVYAKGYSVTEIDAHFGDALLYKVEDHSAISRLDSDGKFALSYMLASKLLHAASRVKANIQTDTAHFTFAAQNVLQDGNLLRYPFAYTDTNKAHAALVLTLPTINSVPFTLDYVREFLDKNIQYAKDKKAQIETSTSAINNLDDARKILKNQLL